MSIVNSPSQVGASVDDVRWRRELHRLKKVPTLPRLLQRILAALDDAEVDLTYLAELIEVDQALVSQILRVANSAFYVTEGATTRIDRALVKLGAAVTRSVILTTAVLDPKSVRLPGFWEHSLGCAVAAGALAKATGAAEPEVVVAAGLMHDIGKVALFQQLPEAFEHCVARAAAEERSLRDIEREVLGADHAEIAAWFLESWNFPPRLAQPILHHHAPSRCRSAGAETAIVHVANSMVRAIGFGCGGDARIPEISTAAWELLQLDAPRLDRAFEIFDEDLDRALNYAVYD
jgi:putative nucleotidyltransferase with HDIG domain